MDLLTISQVSKMHGISARMLRYYEQVGLISSTRNEGNAYRLYDESALKRVQQIIILRKLQIPVKQICVIMNSPDAVKAIDIFKQNLNELDSEITALSTIKSILDDFVKRLEELADLQLNLDFLQDGSVLKLTRSLSLIQRNVKDGVTMNQLDKAADALNKLRDVRIIYLPPMSVASVFCVGDDSRERAWRAANEFVRAYKLLLIKPDLRVFRIEHANATGQSFGDEIWVSIPDEMPLPSPFVKKRFLGGQYAAHLLGEDGFLTYLGLQDWINENEQYQYDYDGNLLRLDPPMPEIDSFGGVNLDPEEILNYPAIFEEPDREIQYDVLFPIRRYREVSDTPVEIPGSLEKCGYRASIVTMKKFRIMGYTKIITAESVRPEQFENELKDDGRLAILNRYKRPGAPVLHFGSHDMDSQMRGGWRWTVCLAESDITDVQAFLRQDVYSRTIDAAKWLIIEYAESEPFDDHGVCMKLGYTWNGVISGSFHVRPENGAEQGGMAYCWYPVK